MRSATVSSNRFTHGLSRVATILLLTAAGSLHADSGLDRGVDRVEDLKLLPDVSFAFFGHRIAQSGDLVAVGAYAADVDGVVDAGAVYVHRRDQGGAGAWGLVKKVSAPDRMAKDYFGYAIALWGEIMVVSAPATDEVCPTNENCNSGSVYIFYRDYGGPDNWGFVKKFQSSDIEEQDWFGRSLSLFGYTLAVGVPYEDTAGSQSGAVYIFERDFGGAHNWGELKKIMPSNPVGSESFGDDRGLSLSANTLVVGGRLARNASNVQTGAAYIYERHLGGLNNWGEVDKLLASDGTNGDYFGVSTRVWGDTIAVGASRDDDTAASAGSVYLYGRDVGGAENWGQITKLVASDPSVDTELGAALSLYGGTLVAGAPRDDDNGSESGSAYLFHRDQGGPDSWGEVDKLLPSDPSEEDFLGYAVSVAGDTAVVGAFSQDAVGSSSGAAYLYNLGLSLPLDLLVGGVCPGQLSTQLTGATPGGTVILLWGTAEGATVVPPGVPCEGLELGLANPQLLKVVSADGSGELLLNPNSNPGYCAALLQAVDLTTCTASQVTAMP